MNIVNFKDFIRHLVRAQGVYCLCNDFRMVENYTDHHNFLTIDGCFNCITSNINSQTLYRLSREEADLRRNKVINHSSSETHTLCVLSTVSEIIAALQMPDSIRMQNANTHN